MQIQSVDNYSLNFGAKTVYKSIVSRDAMKNAASHMNPSFVPGFNRAADILNTYHPNATITMGISLSDKFGPILYAKNSETGAEMHVGYPLWAKDSEEQGNAVCQLVSDLVNPTLLEHGDFWYGLKKGSYPEKMITETPTPSNNPPEMHKIFE